METRIDPEPVGIWNDDTPAVPIRIGNVQEPVSGEIVIEDEPEPIPLLDRDWEEPPDAAAVVDELVSDARQSAAAAAWRDRYL